MAGIVALVCPRTGSWSTSFAWRMDCSRSTGTSFRTKSRGKSQPAAFQCSAQRFPPDDRAAHRFEGRSRSTLTTVGLRLAAQVMSYVGKENQYACNEGGTIQRL